MDSLPELGLHQPDADAAPVAWVLHDGKAGMRSQALGLAEATGFRIVEKPLTIRAPWSLLPRRVLLPHWCPHFSMPLHKTSNYLPRFFMTFIT